MANIQARQPRTHLDMIPRSHFTKIADAHEVDAKTVERDYVLTHVVTAIAQQAAEHGLVFKGGTGTTSLLLRGLQVLSRPGLQPPRWRQPRHSA